MLTKRFSALIGLICCGICSSVNCEQKAAITVTAKDGRQQISTTNTEPGIYTLQKLHDVADDVSIVEIVGGDTESYESAVYKAKVLIHFKGPATGEIIYLGPYIGTRLGGTYLVFLRKSNTISPSSEKRHGFGRVPYAKVFDEGYSSMEISYECVFHGNDVSQNCAYGARVCTDYIKLPESIEVSPEVEGFTPFGCRWAKRDGLLAQLSAMKSR
jgi:hypothetical protein